MRGSFLALSLIIRFGVVVDTGHDEICKREMVFVLHEHVATSLYTHLRKVHHHHIAFRIRLAPRRIWSSARFQCGFRRYSTSPIWFGSRGPCSRKARVVVIEVSREKCAVCKPPGNVKLGPEVDQWIRPFEPGNVYEINGYSRQRDPSQPLPLESTSGYFCFRFAG